MFYKKELLMLILAMAVTGCQPGLFISPASLPIQEVIQECVPIQEELPKGLFTNGKILFGDFSEHAGSGEIMVLTPEASQPIYLPDVPSFSGGEQSPDGKLFAYETAGEDNSSTLVVLNVNGEVVFTLPWDEKWGGFYWLNNQQLEFPYFWNGYWQNAPPISDIISVTTRQRETIAPELPDSWIPGGPQITRLVVWKTAYDPTLSVVGYIRGNEPEQSFVLWDLKNNRGLWELDEWTKRTVPPAWTQDGKKLAVVVLNEKEDNWDRFELYLIDHNGDAEKWIDIREYFKDDFVSITWSPDGRYLAITPFYKTQPLLILDTRAKKLLDYCIPANGVSWSPDSKQILLLQKSSNSGYLSLILDIKNRKAAYIMKNPKIESVGWLVNSP